MTGYMQITGIPGGATDADHKDWIIIQGVRHGVSRNIQVGALDHQRVRGITTLNDIQIVHEVDQASPKLHLAAAQGTMFPTVSIDMCTTVKGKNQPYYQIKLENVVISKVDASHSTKLNEVATEELHMNYTAINWTYVIVDPKTGSPQGNVPAKFDLGTTQGS